VVSGELTAILPYRFDPGVDIQAREKSKRNPSVCSRLSNDLKKYNRSSPLTTPSGVSGATSKSRVGVLEGAGLGVSVCVFVIVGVSVGVSDGVTEEVGVKV
jgi:hypothetical protein